MIRNKDGLVYVRYHQPVPKYINVGGDKYICDVRYGVSMLLVDESKVQALLDHLGGCCGGKKKVFHLPSQEAVTLWETGTR